MCKKLSYIFYLKLSTLLLGLLLLLFSCQQEEKTGPPADVLPIEKTVQIQVQLQLAEAMVANTHARMDTATFLFHRMKDEIFAKNKVDTAAYCKSYFWYASNIEYMDAIYKAVNDSLAVRKSSKNIRF